MNILVGLIASVIIKIIDKFLDKKKESKNSHLDISSTQQKKTLCNIIHPNTRFTWTGNGFGDHC
jgi:hypothetical protein